jgi:hypothetical protein
MLSFHVHLDIPSGLFSSGLATKILYALAMCRTRTTCTVQLTLPDPIILYWQRATFTSLLVVKFSSAFSHSTVLQLIFEQFFSSISSLYMRFRILTATTMKCQSSETLRRVVSLKLTDVSDMLTVSIISAASKSFSDYTSP